jgi:hypothetical protein
MVVGLGALCDCDCQISELCFAGEYVMLRGFKVVGGVLARRRSHESNRSSSKTRSLGGWQNLSGLRNNDNKTL